MAENDKQFFEDWKLEQGRQQTTQMVRSPRNLADQMQQGFRKKYALQTGLQLSLFPELPEEVKQKVKQREGKEEDIYIGMDLDGAGWRLAEALQLLLYRHSQTTDQTAPDYYMGDYAKATEQKGLISFVDIGGGEKSKTPVIITTPTELAAIYSSSKKPSGKQIKLALDTLRRYSKQNYYMDYTEWYTEQYTDKNGLTKEKKKGRRIKGYYPLYICVESEDIEKEDTSTTVKNRAINIQLNPIWQRQIATHYNSKPTDFMDRVLNAYGKKSRELPPALLPFINKLVDAQHYQAANGIPDCTYHCKQLGTPANMGLYDMISPNWVKKREWKKLEQTLADFIRVATEIGLLQKHWVENSKQDGKPVHFFQVVKFGEWK